MDRALACFEAAAEQGHAGAQVEAALMLLHGIVGEAAPERALQWLLHAEAQAHPFASYLLAWIAAGDSPWSSSR